MELETLGGSGLFPVAAILEHSCMPSCSYTTSGHTLFLTCTRALKKGDRLSIDYGNLHYTSTIARQKYTIEKYGFRCTCHRCLQCSDFSRAFRCTRSTCTNHEEAIMYPAAPTILQEKLTNTTKDENAVTAEAEETPSANVTDRAVDLPTLGLWTACPNCEQGPTTEQVDCYVCRCIRNILS